MSLVQLKLHLMTNERPRLTEANLKRTIRGLTDLYIQFRETGGCRHLDPASISAYRRDLADLADFCGSQRLVDLDQIEFEHLKRFRQALLDKKLKSSTILRKASVVNNFLEHFGVQPRMHTYGLEIIDKRSELLSKGQKELLMAYLEKRRNNASTLRRKIVFAGDAFVIALILNTGAFIREIPGLQGEDIFHRHKGFSVRFRGRTGQMVFALNEDATRLYENYRKLVGPRIGRNLFGWSQRQALWQRLNEYGNELGFKVTPTVLRKTFARGFKGSNKELANALGINVKAARNVRKRVG